MFNAFLCHPCAIIIIIIMLEETKISIFKRINYIKY